MSSGFFPAPGTNYSVGDEPTIASRLGRLARSLGLHLVGLSGYRSPSHSVAVGGFANDPHTRGQASDTPGIENVSEAVLNRFGLTRPFGGAREANHIQLLGNHSSSMSAPVSSQQTAVNQAAAQWGVPAYILTGVWGMETNFGQNVATSSAGAIGDFQFLPSTAKGRGYPLTNTPNAQQFAQQASAAAKYLRELHDQYGNWNDALLHYSGGGYGLTQVQNKAPRGRNFGSGNSAARTRPGGQSQGQPEGPDVTSVLSDWADAQSADPSTVGDGNQFASFIPGLPGLPGLGPLGLGLPNPLDLFKNLSGSINSVTDFLKVLAWIINPVNILRTVEVLVGLTLMAFGFQAMLQAYGERREGFVTSENPLSRSGLGRVSREVANAVTTAVPEARAAKATKAGTAAKSAKPTESRTRKPRSAPHKSRREALRLRYEREETRRSKR